MKKPTLSRKPSRHPAVIDLLDGSPTAGNPPGARTTAPGDPATPPPPPPRPRSPVPPARGGRGPGKKAMAAVAAVAVAVACGVAISHLRKGDSETAPTAATTSATAAVDENGLPILNLPEPAPTEQTSASDGECRADRGDQKSGAGVIAAFNFAYYSQRNGETARALATPSSSVLPGPELQKVIDAVPVGTNYCLRTVELSDGVYLVDLSVMQPAQPVKRGTQTVTTQKVDGRWYVDVFT
ncbi:MULTISPECIES: hypothetical protein [unclassified Rhodococcus (in: high G+C Gram-positive bacteria)]|uniref:hypothetical protein n=1 Tax=unclassified Rhodococcus (in: high G+C Gram-positive bacteria) TaxID=192944 RepID=UPI00178C259F|nr:hypothetical protein [Rhodococcus sp. DK17]